MARPKKQNPNIVDISDLSEMETARADAEGRLQAMSAAPFNRELFEALLGQLSTVTQPIIEKRDAALDRAAGAINSRCNPVLDIYRAIEKTLRARLEAGT